MGQRAQVDDGSDRTRGRMEEGNHRGQLTIVPRHVAAPRRV